jgi:hypothetical protein
MVTSRMRAILENELGYLPEEVDVIEPQIAAVLIEKALVRPEAGMPSTWKRQVRKKNALAEMTSRIGDSFKSLKRSITNLSKNIVKLTRKRILPILIPVLFIAVGYKLFMSFGSKSIISTVRDKQPLKPLKPLKRASLDLNLLQKVQDPNAIERFKLRSELIRNKFF